MKKLKKAFEDLKGIYVSKRIEQVLKARGGVVMSARTLRNQINRFGLVFKTRIPKRVYEVKDTKFGHKDLVMRNYNLKTDFAVATGIFMLEQMQKKGKLIFLCALVTKRNL